MKIKHWIHVFLMVMFVVACSNEPINEPLPSPSVETLGEYEWIFHSADEGSGQPDTLRMAALGGELSYTFTVRRKVFEDGAFTGRYTYTKVHELSCSEAASFHPTLTGADDTQTITLSLHADEWKECDRPLIEKLPLAVGNATFTLPIKQEAAKLTKIGEHYILHTSMEDKVVYLDHKGDTISFKAALAVPYAINGKLQEDMVWCEEDAVFSYTLSDSTWIRVLNVNELELGLYHLLVESVADPDRETHDAILTLSFNWDGTVYSKEVVLQSTEVFHVEIVD